MQNANWVWWHATAASHIVIAHEGALWFVPYRPGGWADRAPYQAYRESLREVLPDAAQRIMAQYVGYPTETLTLADAATLAEVHPATLRQAISGGRLAATKRGRDWQVTRAEIERYIAGRKPRPRRASES